MLMNELLGHRVICSILSIPVHTEILAEESMIEKKKDNHGLPHSSAQSHSIACSV